LGAVAWHPGEFTYKSTGDYASGAPNYGGVSNVAIGDVTGDSLNDIVVGDPAIRALVVIPGAGTDTFGTPVVTTLGPDDGYRPGGSLALEHINGDAALDVVVGTRGFVGDQYQWHLLTLFGSSSGSLVGQIASTATPQFFARVAGMNANGDSKPDVVVQSTTDIEIGLGNGDGTFTFPAALTFPFGASGGGNAVTDPVVGDLNGGTDDVAYGNGSGSNPGTLGVLLSGPGGTYSSTLLPNLGTGLHLSVAIGSFGSDPANDVLTLQSSGHPTTGQVDMFNGDGSGGFGTGASVLADGDPYGMTVADFDNDGRQDLMTVNYGIRDSFPSGGRYPSAVNFIRNTPSGLEVLPVVPDQDFLAPGFHIASGDLNGDGVPDVAAATSGGLVVYRSYDDSVPPETAIDSGPGAMASSALARDRRAHRRPPTIHKRRPTFSFDASEDGAAFTCRVDHAAASECRPPFKVPRLHNGRHTFRVSANDLAQNVDPTAARTRFIVEPRRSSH
jgi:hypothetical protein